MRLRLDWAFAAGLACLLVLYPLATRVGAADFIMAHDADVPATVARALQQVHILKPINGGLVQGIAPPMSFNTAIAYGTLLAAGIAPAATQVGVMTFTFAVALLIAIAGFERLLARWGRPACAARRVDACLLGALYLVSPFTLIYVSDGVFWSVNIALAIGVLPLTFYFYLRCFADQAEWMDAASVAALASCVIVVCWSVLFIFPALVAFAVLLILRGHFGRVDFAKVIALAALAIVGSAPSLYGMYLSAVDAGWSQASDPVTANATFESIRGGVLTGFLQYASWLIYTPWTPRLVLGFPAHFMSAWHVTLALSLVAMVVALPLVERRDPMRTRYLWLAGLLMVVLFFVKGPGPPFGFLFREMLEHVPGAGLVRTPDTKFGLFVLLALASIAALALSGVEPRLAWFRKTVRVVIIASAAYHAAPLVEGTAILARGSQFAAQPGRGYDVTLSTAEKRIVAILQAERARGVLMLPPTFGLETRRDGGLFSYRNVIAEFAPNQFFYSEWKDAPSSTILERLRAAVDDGDWAALEELGIGFVLVNRNGIVRRADHYALYDVLRTAPGAWTLAYQGGGYELYRLAAADRRPLVSVAMPTLRPAVIESLDDWYAVVRVSAGPGEFPVILRTPENRHWTALVLPEGCTWRPTPCAAWAFLNRRASATRAQLPWSDLANRWRVHVSAGDGTPSERTIAFVFVPQLVMYAAIAASIAMLLACVTLAFGARAVRDGQESGV